MGCINLELCKIIKNNTKLIFYQVEDIDNCWVDGIDVSKVFNIFRFLQWKLIIWFKNNYDFYPLGEKDMLSELWTL